MNPSWTALELAESWALTPEERAAFRALTPLIYSHINPYGVFRLDMQSRLPLQELAVAA